MSDKDFTLPPWFWKLPMATWPAYWLYYPPGLLWRLWARAPTKIRWAVANWATDRPGICGQAVYHIGAAEYPDSGLSARSCLRDGAPCWCGKYQTASCWADDMALAPADPMGRVSISFTEEAQQ